VHFHQKWRLVWPHLARLPRRGIRLLDAGCGDGQWSIEIAARRPDWMVTGVDRDESVIERAERRRRWLDVPNVDFVARDFFAFSSETPYDAVLGICSTHYGSYPQDTERLFAKMRGWLRPGGRVFLLLPRSRTETSFVTRLGRPAWRDHFDAAGISWVCQRSHLTVDRLDSCIGRVGALAKQLDWQRDGVAEPLNSAIRLLSHGLGLIDAYLPTPRQKSLMWLLVGHRGHAELSGSRLGHPAR
jgi:SAM-dependent methyltransferase